MRFRLLGIFTLLALLINVGAQAATLAGLHGDVLVNRGGGGYVPASGAMELVPGDSVMAQANGGGEITYPDGCKVQVAPVGVVAIAEHSPCAIETGSNSASAKPVVRRIYGHASSHRRGGCRGNCGRGCRIQWWWQQIETREPLRGPMPKANFRQAAIAYSNRL